MSAMAPPLLEVQGVSKYFGSVVALDDVSLDLQAGEVLCLLGDNGAGKSTLIHLLSGVHRPSRGALLLDGDRLSLAGPRQARARGIATVYQDLSLVPLMSITRNFFMGREPTTGWGPFRRFDVAYADRVVHEELAKIGIDLREPSQVVGTLSGGERQCVAIARAVYFGARVLILDEPTSALGVQQAEIVLRYTAQAADRGVGVIFITHNVHHAYAVGHRFTLLNRGRCMGTFPKAEVDREAVLRMMAGGPAADHTPADTAKE